MKREKQNLGSILFDIINPIILITFAILCIYPFYYMIIFSLSDPVLSASGIGLLPKGFTTRNYVEVFKMPEILPAFFVSVFRTVVGSTLTVACSCFLAYLVTKPEMYFRRIIYRYTIITMYVGGGLIPTYLVMRAYGLRNNILVYIIPGLVSAYSMILIKTYIEQLPQSLEEAAMIDGAGIFVCWSRIVLPLCMPVLATCMIFAMVGQWNSWFDCKIYITDKSLWTLQYVLLYHLQRAQTLVDEMMKRPSMAGEFKISPTAVRMTITAIATLPILVVYPFMQKYFVKGIMIGAVKG